jgi:polysaccharide pyruvyl transferase WcaK-like protein
VLYYLSSAIATEVGEKVKINLSSSDGEVPFWWHQKNSESCYWPGGRIFKSPSSSIFGNFFKKVNFTVQRKLLYKVFIFLYSHKYDRSADVFANLFFGRKFKKLIKEADFVFCTGGHHISNVLEKDCINPQLVSLAIASLHRKKTILWSQSVGPFTGAPQYVIKAIGRTLNSCKNIYVRDQLSVECVQNVSIIPPVETPDSVFLSKKMEFEVQPKSSTIVCAVYTAGVHDHKYLKKYAESWKDVALSLVDKGYSVKFIPMQYKGYGGDERGFLKSLVEICNTKSVTYLDDDCSPRDTIVEFSKAACVIGHKTHSVIYGLALGVPTVAIAYHEKTNYFMSLFGLQDKSFSEIIGNENKIIRAVDAAILRDSPSEKVSLAFANVLDQKIKESLDHQ